MLRKLSAILYPKSFPPQQDLGLLLLRVCTITQLFLKHGIEKILNFQAMSQNFPDPVGLGVFPTFLIACLSDVICSWLIILGVCTRWVALFVFCNIFVGWSLRHHFLFWFRGNWHGEMMTIYLGALVAIIFLGPGKYSVDYWLQKKLDA